MTDKQIETDASPQGGEKGNSGGPANLDSLLKEFDSGSKPETKPDPVKRVLTELAPVIEYAKSNAEKEQKADIDNTVKSAIQFLKEDEALKDIPDKVVRGLLYEYSGENESFRTAFLNRSSNPQAWKTALTEARKSAAVDLKPAAEDTKRIVSDTLAARAAISGGVPTQGDAPKGPTPAQMMRMSEREWMDFTREQAAAARG